MTGELIFPEWKIDTPLEEIIGNAVGAASTCWENLEDTGVFDSERASQIVDETVAIIKKKLFTEEA
jgi:hypothetical protein